MKKTYLIIVLFALASTVTINCSKKTNDANNCTDLLSKANASELTYTANPTIVNCQACKTALSNLLNCSYLSAEERADYKKFLDSMPPC